MPDPVARLDVFRHCPRCGAAATNLRPPHLVVCPHCDLHLYLNASAATAAILVDRRCHVLLIRRAKDPAKGKLAFPGGFVDNGETLENGLRREIREETGLELGDVSFLLSHPNRYTYRGVTYDTIDVIFVAHLPDFASARPLDAVAELVTLPVADVRGDDLAFESMQVAWRAFRHTCETGPNRGGEVIPRR
jgi:ADP-ribose pyrophosphatase YjhB (NUDIX family)